VTTKLGAWVRAHREELGRDRAELAADAGVSEEVLRDLEEGRQLISARLAYKVRAAVLRLKPALEHTAPVLEGPEYRSHSMTEEDFAFPPKGSFAQIRLFRSEGRLGVSIAVDPALIASLVPRVQERIEGVTDGGILKLTVRIDGEED
jgi:DNA-binding XRE family transcriptional regulator